MADFCRQCTIKYFGAQYADYNDFRGLISENESNGGQYIIPALCEGCGFSTVGPNGICLGGCSENSHNNTVIESRAIIKCQ